MSDLISDIFGLLAWPITGGPFDEAQLGFIAAGAAGTYYFVDQRWWAVYIGSTVGFAAGVMYKNGQIWGKK